jgi:predicted ATPase with chaperone activity
MKRSIIFFLLLSIILVISYGCASKDYVRQQVEPLVDRINKLEARVSALETRIGQMGPGGASSADVQQALKEAREARSLAEQAKECCKPGAGAGAGEDAARRAEEAAKRAEAAANKAEKAFELQQRK